MMNYRYGASGEEMHHDNFEDALTDLIEGDYDYPYWVGQVVHIHRSEEIECKPSDFMTRRDVDILIEMWEEKAYEEYDDVFDGFTQNVDRQALLKHIHDWMNQNMECNFVGLKNYHVIEHTITEEDLRRAFL